MKRRTFLSLLGCGPLVFAADPWKDKQVSEWTRSEVQRAVTKSPWAKEVEVVTILRVTHKSTAKKAATNTTNKKGKNADPIPVYQGGTAATSSTSLIARAVVRWESAQPMIDVGKLSRSKDATNFYILSVTGVPFDALEKHLMKETEGRIEPHKVLIGLMKEGAKLEVKGKESISADRVGVVEGELSRPIAVFLFSKESVPIDLTDKEVTFRCKNRLLEMKAKFVPQEMVYGGKLEL